MQQSTVATTLPAKASPASQTSRFVLLVARLSAALLAGCLAVVGPWAMDLVVGRALSAKVSRILSARTGLSIRIGRIRPTGLLSAGLVGEDVRLTDHRLSMTAERVIVNRTWSRTSITVVSPILVGRRKDLARMIHRLTKSASKGTSPTAPTKSGSLRRLLARASIRFLDAKARLQGDTKGSQQLRLAVKSLRIDRHGKRRTARASLTARFDFPEGVVTVWMEHLDIRLNRLTAWMVSDEKDPSRLVRRFLHSAGSPRLDWVEKAKGRIALSFSPAGARRYLRCSGSCRSAQFQGSFFVEALAEGLTNARLRFTDSHGLARIRLQATADRIANQWRIQASFQDLPARALGRILPGIDITQGRMDGAAAIRSRGNRLQGLLALRLDGDLFVHNKLVAHRPLSWRGLDLDVNLAFVHDQRGWTALIRRGQFKKRNIGLGIQGQLLLRADRTWKADLTARLPKRPCQDLLDALPSALIPVLEGMKLGGDLGGTLHFSADSRALEHLVASLQTSGRCRVLKDASAADPHELLRNDVSMTIQDAQGRRATLALGPRNPAYRPIQRLPAHLIRAFLITEDRRFFSHRGFDWEQIQRALAIDIQKHSVIKGASTISQQVVKNLYLTQHRTLSRKLQEAILTWRMEQIVPKRRILELYLNLVEMGPGLYGVTQGAHAYFHKPARFLTPLESMHLASITPAPRRYYRIFKSKGRVGMAWLRRLRNRLHWMERFGWISKPAYAKLAQSELFLASF